MYDSEDEKVSFIVDRTMQRAKSRLSIGRDADDVSNKSLEVRSHRSDRTPDRKKTKPVQLVSPRLDASDLKPLKRSKSHSIERPNIHQCKLQLPTYDEYLHLAFKFDLESVSSWKSTSDQEYNRRRDRDSSLS